MEIVKKKLEFILEETGFKQVEVNGALTHTRSGKYYKISFIEGLKAFVLESAEDEVAAEKNVFEDSDLYPLALGETGMIEKLRSDLAKYYL